MSKKRPRSPIRPCTRQTKRPIEHCGLHHDRALGGRHRFETGMKEVGQHKEAGGVRVSRLKAGGIGKVMVSSRGRRLLGGQLELGNLKKRKSLKW